MLVMGLTMAATCLTINVIEIVREGRFERFSPYVAPLVSASLVFGFLFTDALRYWSDGAYLTLQYATGKIDELGYAKEFRAPGVGYTGGPSTETGLWLRANTKPTDTLLVRGFEPQIYAVSDRHYTGRWFWSTFLTFQTRAYRRPEYLAEDATWLDQHPPDYVVALDFVPPEGIDSVGYFEKRGYTVRYHAGYYVVLGRQ